MNKRELDIKKNPKEIRLMSDFEVRQETKDKMILNGYCLKFNSQTLIGDSFIESIDPNALDNTEMKKVPLKYNHNDSYVALASTRNGSLKLTVDDIGLYFEAELLNIQAHKDIYEMVRNGLVSKCSFAFTINMDGGSEWNWDVEPAVRRILKIDRLYDVSIVDEPAYENTEVYARGLNDVEAHKAKVEAEKAKRDLMLEELKLKIKIGE